MAFRALIAGVMLLGSLTQAVPVDQDVTKANPVELIPANQTLASAVHNFYCNINGYTYTNEGSGGSPTNGDCKVLVANIDKDGAWKVMENTQHQIAEYESCAFGVEPAGHTTADIVIVGNGDIQTVINEAIKQFGGGGRVGASGFMYCKKFTDIWSGEYAKMKWGIYHN